MMKPFYLYRKFLLFVAIFTVLFIGSSCQKEGASKIVIHGSTTVYPLIKKVSEAYKKSKGTYIELRADGSHTGIEHLIAGSCDIATSSSPISSQLRKEAQSKGVSLKRFIFAYDIIVPIVHPTNSVHDLSLNQLKAIYTGSVLSWDQLGGRAETIKAVCRDDSSGTRDIWHQKVVGTDSVPQNQPVLHTNSEVLAYVAKEPAAIGYIGFDYINKEIKPISVNGIKPSLENAKEKKFPIHRNLYLYVDEKKFTSELKSFIIYVMSSEGQKIVEQNGYIPLYPFSTEQ